jgi:hypothetical protein
LPKKEIDREKWKMGAETVSHTVFSTHRVLHAWSKQDTAIKYPNSAKSQVLNITRSGDI